MKLAAGLLAVCSLAVPSLRAQNPAMQQSIADVKESMALNKLLLGQYKWTEQDVISIKGEEKKEELFQVQLGPDGKPQKTPIDPSAAPGHERGIRGRIKEKMTAEYEDYGNRIKNLIAQYLPPDPATLQIAFQQGNVTLGPVAGTEDQIRVEISNYWKQGDSMTLIMDRPHKALVSLAISSYLEDPKDAVTVDAQFASIPNGPNHIATQTVTGVSKHLTIAVQNLNYQHM